MPVRQLLAMCWWHLLHDASNYHQNKLFESANLCFRCLVMCNLFGLIGFGSVRERRLRLSESVGCSFETWSSDSVRVGASGRTTIEKLGLQEVGVGTTLTILKQALREVEQGETSTF